MSTGSFNEPARGEQVTRRRLLQRAGLGGVALTVPGALAACGSSSSSSTTAAKTVVSEPLDHLTWVIPDLQTMDAPAKDTGASLQAATIATEQIVKYDENLNVVGHLAESWKAVDEVTYVYKVRQGVKFWDGSPLTAEDIAFAMTRHIDPKVASQLAGVIPKVESIEATAPDEVTVKLAKPDATWPFVPTRMLVAPKAFIEKMGKDFGAAGKPMMGTGPYKLTAFKSGQSLEFVANDNYWGPKPIARRLTVNAIRDSQARVLAARGGAMDGTFVDEASEVKDYRSIDALHIQNSPQENLTFVHMDNEAKPWDDVHVRRAFAYSIDRPGLIHALLAGDGQVANSMVTRILWGSSLPKDRLDELYASLPQYEFDLDKAKAELAQSKYPQGFTATVWNYHSDLSQRICVSWAENLKKIGVTLELEEVSDPEGTAREVDHRDLGMSLHAWEADFADPINYAILLLPSYAAEKGYFNESNYKNPAVDKLIADNLASVDADRRAELVIQMMKIIAEDLPYIPLWTTPATVALRDGLALPGFNPFWRQQQWVSLLQRTA